MARLLAAGPGEFPLHRAVQAVLSESRASMGKWAARAREADPFLRYLIPADTVGSNRVREALGPDRALLLPVPAGNVYELFLLGPGPLACEVSPVNRTRLIQAAREFSALLAGGSADTARLGDPLRARRLEELGRELWSALLRPVEKHYAGMRALVVVLPRELAGLPLHALRRGGAGSRFPAEQILVTYAPSVLSLGGPVGTVAPVRELTGAGHAGGTAWDVEYELRDIRAFYRDARLLFTRDATLEALQGGGGDLLHLAALLLPGGRDPANARIRLGAPNASSCEDVSWGELRSIRPRATVVVSPLGPVERPEAQGVLAEVFLTNGSREVVMMTFPPARRSKKYFGEVFYTELLSGADVRTAYRRVQTEMIGRREYAALPLWAPYMLWTR